MDKMNVLLILNMYSLLCFTDGLRLLPAVSILRRGLVLSVKNAASLSNVDRNLAATATDSNLSQSDTATGILSSTILYA